MTGSILLQILLDNSDYSHVYSLVRKPGSSKNDKMTEIVFDFNQPKYTFEGIPQIDEVFCCLGSTMKKAGGKEAFRKVDYTYPLQLAQFAAEKSVKKFLCISAMGADAKSGIFYNKVKGEMERDICALSIPCITFFRPSLLLGDRKENRPGERIGIIFSKLINPLMIGPLKNYKAISATKVATAMMKEATSARTGVRVVLSGEMQ